MRLIAYILIFVNVIILLLNWDQINSYVNPTEKTENLKEEKEQTLVLANAESLPVAPRNQKLPTVVSAGPTAHLIDRIWDGIVGFFHLFLDLISPGNRKLPQPPPIIEKPVPIQEPVQASYCIDMGAYKSIQNALVFKEKLITKGIPTQLRREQKNIPQKKQHRVFVRVRANLDTAKELSDILSGAGVKNQMQENRPLGYLIRTSAYSNKTKAEKILRKIEGLGMSAYLGQETNKKNVKTAPAYVYYLRINKKDIAAWNKLNEKEDIHAQTEKDIRFRQNTSCQ